jgi:hypothetical protein
MSGHPPVDAKLVPECEDLDLHREARPKQVPQEGGHGEEKRQHSWMLPRRCGGRMARQEQVPVTCHNSPRRMVFLGTDRRRGSRIVTH